MGYFKELDVERLDEKLKARETWENEQEFVADLLQDIFDMEYWIEKSMRAIKTRKHLPMSEYNIAEKILRNMLSEVSTIEQQLGNVEEAATQITGRFEEE